jgi:hypothetical protein
VYTCDHFGTIFMSNLTCQSTAVVCYYPQDMGAMTSLNLAGNWLKAEGAKHIAGAIKVSKYALAVILVRVSCESDYWYNCC